VRAAQAIFLVPLGLLQLVASIAFSTADGLHGARYALAAWAAAMGAAGVAVGLLLGTGRPGVRRLAVALLPAQAAFSLVKLSSTTSRRRSSSSASSSRRRCSSSRRGSASACARPRGTGASTGACR
jgi:hypothetical protein